MDWRNANGSAFIDGDWYQIEGAGAHSIVNPFDEKVYATSALSSEADVDWAVRSAKNALERAEWNSQSLAQRISACRRIGQILDRHKDALAIDISKSMGAPLLFVEQFMLGSVSDLIEMYIDAISSLSLRFVRHDKHGSSLVIRKPVGVVAAIVPWNAPLRSEIKKVIPALLAGNTIVLKPDPQTPWAALVLAESAVEAGIPSGVFNVVLGGSATGQSLVSHPDVNKIAFTGSTEVGQKIGAVAGGALKRMQLELGGKSAAIVLEDADVENIVDSLADGVFTNAGQMCVSNSRILVHKNRYDEVVDALTTKARSYRLGDPFDVKTTMGPLVSSSQRDRVRNLLRVGKSEGAKFSVGDPDSDIEKSSGFFIRPAVAYDLDNSMTLAQEEIFGPVASVIKFEDDAHAIALANDSRYGLGGAVYSSAFDRSLAVAAKVRSGFVSINRFGIDSSGPFGGIGMSGVGREHGPESFESYLEYVAFPFRPDELSMAGESTGIGLDDWLESGYQ